MPLSQSTDHESNCLTAIKEVLSKKPNRIELLPSFLNTGDELVFCEEGTATLPQSTLIAAYRMARGVFSNCPSTSSAKVESLSNFRIEELILCSLILLLVTSEHLTALNFRKRILTSRPSLLSAKKELAFTTLILSSPLYKHAKSPVIWSHRKWVIKTFTSPEEIPYEDEMALIMAAGETHPKNYYVWSYARWIFARCGSYWPLAEGKTRLTQWCILHPSDVSGWGFMLYLMRQELTPDDPEISENEAILEEVLRFCLEVAPERDAIWLFILGYLQTLPLDNPERERIVQLLKSSTFEASHPRYLREILRFNQAGSET